LPNPPAPSSTPPTAINGCRPSAVNKPCDPASNAIDVFFVNTYGGTGVSTPQFGFSWINGDGVSIGSGVFSTALPRYDTLAHEIGHALALTHQNFGATNDPDSSARRNMMQLGSDMPGPPAMLGRATSYNSGCQNIMGNFSNGPPPILKNGALYDLGYSIPLVFDPCMGQYAMSADHLTTGPACTSSNPPNPPTLADCTNEGASQEAAAAISPFINATAPNNANAGGGQAFLANLATTSAPSSGGSGPPAPLQITITADGNPNDANVIPDLAATIIALLPSDPLSFNGNQPVAQIGGTPINPNVTCDANNLQNCAVTVTVTKLTNQQVTGNPGCDSGTGQPPSSQCIRITYSVAPTNGFGPDNPACQFPGNCVTAGSPVISVILAVSFNKSANDISSQNLLAGAQYTSIDANGFATTTLFGNAVPAGSPNGVFTANSANPDLTTANVLLNAKTFQNASAVKFGSPPFNNRNLAHCTQPWITVVSKNGKQTGTAACPAGSTNCVCPDGNISGGPD
jgi:hypothetical protein